MTKTKKILEAVDTKTLLNKADEWNIRVNSIYLDIAKYIFSSEKLWITDEVQKLITGLRKVSEGTIDLKYFLIYGDESWRK